MLARMKQVSKRDGTQGRSYEIFKRAMNAVRYEDGDRRKPNPGGTARMSCMLAAMDGCGCKMFKTEGNGPWNVNIDYFCKANPSHRTCRADYKEGGGYDPTYKGRSKADCLRGKNHAFFGEDPRNPFKVPHKGGRK